jgi:hypothetical protein
MYSKTCPERSTVKPGKPKFIETNFCVRNRYMFGSIHFQIKLKYFLHWDFLKCLAYSIMVYTELGLDRNRHIKFINIKFYTCAYKVYVCPHMTIHITFIHSTSTFLMTRYTVHTQYIYVLNDKVRPTFAFGIDTCSVRYIFRLN